MYRRFLPLSQIAKRLQLTEGYGISPHVARNAVVYALRGFNWGFGAKSYDGLITDAKELKRIETGYRTRTGKRIKRQKIGIFRLTPEEQSRAGRMGAEAIGGVAFTKQEIECALRLCNNPRYRYGEGRYEGKPKLEAVAQELNKRFHQGRPVRTKYSVNYLRTTAKRRLG